VAPAPTIQRIAIALHHRTNCLPAFGMHDQQSLHMLQAHQETQDIRRDFVHARRRFTVEHGR
jgi:hypothetical protein